jgi:uncharacterized protein
MTMQNSPNRVVESVNYEQIRPFFQWVYTWMGAGLLITTAVAYLTANNSILRELSMNPLVVFGALIAQIVMVIFIGVRFMKMSATTVGALFAVYAALNGFTISLIVQSYTSAAVTQAFLSTVILFGLMSVIGFTTTIDLTKLGTILLVGLLAIIVSSIINIFLGSSTLDLIIAIAGVVIFTGLTAYDTQKLKRIAMSPELGGQNEMGAKLAIFGALQLYLDFINMFLFLLRLFGRNR